MLLNKSCFFTREQQNKDQAKVNAKCTKTQTVTGGRRDIFVCGKALGLAVSWLSGDTGADRHRR